MLRFRALWKVLFVERGTVIAFSGVLRGNSLFGVVF